MPTFLYGDTRGIRAAIRNYGYGRARWYPEAELMDGRTERIRNARYHKGQLEVITMWGDGHWEVARRAFVKD